MERSGFCYTLTNSPAKLDSRQQEEGRINNCGAHQEGARQMKDADAPASDGENQQTAR